ncbi:hypothetical protein [Dactylosporangium sp. CS-033363]|uniref:hypothetical protein n=1 Tax=Dactylosporangium sp. CS-033363 TaxID=3239935 RepID=UPI003D8BAAFD
MSYDLAVWEGDRPANDAAAAVEFERLHDRFLDGGAPMAATLPIASFVTALLERYPEGGDDSPWSVGGLLEDARGPVVYLCMVHSRADEVSAVAADLAEARGLHCYDPQQRRLRTGPARTWRFELTSGHHHPVRDPDPDTVRRVLAHVSRDSYAVLGRADDEERYIQVAMGERAGTRPGWYVLERRDGAPDRHFRAEVTNLEGVIKGFVCFLEDDPTLKVRFQWRVSAVDGPQLP